jgi:Tol biopolymer transport system component
MAQPFDLKRLALSGEAVPVAENVKSIGSQRRGVFSVSQNGMLVYQSGGSGGSHVLTWFDRAGTRVGALGGASDLRSVMLSPDGKRVATSVLDPTGHAFDLWLYDIARDLRTRFTFSASRSYLPAVWSPDGSSIAFAAYRDGKSAVFRKAKDLSGSDELLCDDPAMYPTSWSPDGKTILMVKTTGGNAADSGIFALPLSGDRKPVAIAPAAVAPIAPRFSPDGRWIAYGSIESRRAEIYVVPYSGLGGKLQISANGGVQARWRSDGKEIFYISPDGRLTAVEVKANAAFLEVGRVQPLFGNVASGAGPNLYDVAPAASAFWSTYSPNAPLANR